MTGTAEALVNSFAEYCTLYLKGGKTSVLVLRLLKLEDASVERMGQHHS